jgi:hypothetical protein
MERTVLSPSSQLIRRVNRCMKRAQCPRLAGYKRWTLRCYTRAAVVVVVAQLSEACFAAVIKVLVTPNSSLLKLVRWIWCMECNNSRFIRKGRVSNMRIWCQIYGCARMTDAKRLTGEVL